MTQTVGRVMKQPQWLYLEKQISRAVRLCLKLEIDLFAPDVKQDNMSFPDGMAYKYLDRRGTISVRVDRQGGYEYLADSELDPARIKTLDDRQCHHKVTTSPAQPGGTPRGIGEYQPLHDAGLILHVASCMSATDHTALSITCDKVQPTNLRGSFLSAIES